MVGVRDAADVSAARLLVREVADTISMPSETAERAAIVASELATNQVRYAGCGRVGVRAIERDGIPGIEVDADDEGPGLSDPTRAFGGEGGGTQGTLGIGLASVRRVTAEIDLDTRIGEGTRILARIFAGPVRRRPSVTILGVGLSSESVSGDAAGFWRLDRSLLVMLTDGLGHGRPAREASDRALAVAAAGSESRPEVILSECTSALRGTRGAVIAIGRLDEAGSLDIASVGNIQMGLCDPGGARRIAGSAGYVGSPSPRSIRPIRISAPDGVTWVLATDGIRDPLAACAEARTFPPWALAHRILLHGGTAHDDAMVVVVR